MRIINFRKNKKGSLLQLNKLPLNIKILGFLLILLIVVALASFFVLRATAQNTYNLSYPTTLKYEGVSVHTKVENLMGSLTTNDFYGTATAKSGDTVTFTLTINNPEEVPKDTDVKFTLPPGFTYINNSASNLNFIPKPPAVGGTMTWVEYSAPVGDSTITLQALVP